jgi:hypothetical protein
VCARIIVNIGLVGVYVKEANELKGKERKGNIFLVKIQKCLAIA